MDALKQSMLHPDMSAADVGSGSACRLLYRPNPPSPFPQRIEGWVDL